MAVFRSSGDLSADRRYEYARALLREHDFSAAADLFRQALERAPDWTPAWFGLGEALEACGDTAKAIEAFARTQRLEPDDPLGAGVRLARLGAVEADGAMTPGYVAALFDAYAERFDTHLIEALDYRGPQIVMAALEATTGRRRDDLRFGQALDLGCGTGLMAVALGACVGAVDGVDLSPAMVAQARKRGLYRHLEVADAVDALGAAARRGRRFDLLLAADVLVYLGNLTPLFTAVRDAMADGGLFAFTAQARDGEGFDLGPDLRHRHSPIYIRDAAAAGGLGVRHLEPCVTRLDAGKPSPGLVAVLERADG